MLLENKNAVIYGGGGAVGGAVARAFAREGAKVFLAGRTVASLDRVAHDIRAAGGEAETAEVDALDEEATGAHADSIANKAGSIDVSVNTIGHGDVHGMPLLDMPYEDFARPVTTAMRTLFLTGRAAARHMVRQGSGVIMANVATTAHRVIPNVGGTGVAFDAIESMCRQWAAELGPHGIRAVWLLSTGIPEAMAPTNQMFPDYGTWTPSVTRDEVIALMHKESMLNRLTTLADMGNAAAFAASDLASGMTACAVNVSAGISPSR